MSSEDSPDKLSGVIPDFFADIICRLVPGGLVFFLWFPYEIFQSVDDSLLVRLPCYVATMWLIGVMLDAVPYSLVLILLNFPRIWRRLRNKSHQPKPGSASNGGNVRLFVLGLDCDWCKRTLGVDEQRPTEKDYWRRRVLKEMAEVILFRDLIVVSLLYVVQPPYNYSHGLESWGDRRFVGVVCACVFLMCWLVKHYNLFYLQHPGRPTLSSPGGPSAQASRETFTPSSP